MKNFFLCCLTFSSFCLSQLLVAKPDPDAGDSQKGLKFSHLSTNQGLSQNEVYCILQDRKGFMWFGTAAGLNRYDGYQFIVYKHNPQDSLSLSHNFVLALCEDHAGNLWVGTRGGGLNRFDRKKNQFTRFTADPHRPGALTDNQIWYIYQDREQILWVGTATGGLNRFDYTTETFDAFRYDPNDIGSISYGGVGVILEDHNGVLWLGTERGGLNRFDRASQIFRAFRHDPQNPNSLSNDYVWSIVEDRNGTLWVGTYQGGLNRFNRETETFTHFQHRVGDPNSIGSDLVKAIFEDDAGNLWVGTYGSGLNRLNNDGVSFTHYQHDPYNPGSIVNNHVLTISQNRSGLLWVGTGKGISRSESTKQFTLYQNPDKNGNNDTNDADIWAVFEDDAEAGEKIWVGTRNSGLKHVDRATNKVVHYQHEPHNPNSLISDHVTFITKDQIGVYWIGTFGGLNRFDPATGAFTAFVLNKGQENSLNHNYISFILEDSLNDARILWVGTRGGGLNQMNLSSGRIRHFRFDPEKTYNSEDYIFQIFPDVFENEKVLWLATYGGGLVRFYPGTGKYFAYRHDEHDPYSLSNDDVLSLCKSIRGDYWIGTADGLNRFDPEKEVFEQFHLTNGLPSETIYSILEDNHGNLWMGTNNGISRFDPIKKTFRNYDINDGLPGNQFTSNSGSYFKNQRGELFFGGVNGFISFNPGDIKDNLHIPPIVITDFRVQNHAVPVLGRFVSTDVEDHNSSTLYLQSDITETKEITLSYLDNVFTFEFAALDYSVSEKNQYAYMLEGFDPDWNDVGKRRTATYTNLDPGEYVFRVKGSNNDEVWNDEGTSVKITITPPWWQTWWAYLLFAAAGLALLIAGRRYELNRQGLKYELELEHLQAEKLVEIDRMKSRFFANISHEFRTPLTLIKGPIEKLLAKSRDVENRSDLQLVRKNCQRLLELINQLLDISRLESGRVKLQARREALVGMLRGMVLAFESLAELREIALTFSGPNTPVFAYVERDKLEKIVANLMSNAIKFTPAGGKVAVAVAVSQYSQHGETNGEKRGEKCVEIVISDTGIGIPADQVEHIFNRFYQVDDSATRTYGGTGIGLALTKDLVDLHHGEISVSSEMNVGTRFMVRLPLGKAHLKPEEISDAGYPIPDIDDSSRDSDIKDLITSNDQRITGNSNPVAIDGNLSQSTGTQLSKKKPVILVVEDNPDMRQYLCAALKDLYRTIEAKNGKAGLQKALNKMPGLIISDVMMPEMDGFALCEKLKTDERTSHIPIILLTARASDENKLIGLETGADDYLTKPFNAPELRARIKNLIEQRRRLQKRFQAQIKLEPGDVTVTSMDKKFLEKAIDIIEQHIADTNFSADMFSSEMGMHRVHLNRKIKAITGQTSTLFIRAIRIKRAAQLLKKKSGNISEIAYDVGFKNPAFFATCFREQFGLSPSEYLHQQLPDE